MRKKVLFFQMLGLAGLLLASLICVASGPAAAQNRRVKSRAFVVGSVARLREAPRKDAKVVHQLRIGTEVEVIAAKKVGGRLYQQVRTPYPGEEGWTLPSLLSKQRPTLHALLAKADAAGSPGRARKWLERATALAPGDLKVIERLLANYRALGRNKGAHGVDKGLIAAERRVLSWDGPLYPIMDGQALLPRPPYPRISASTRKTADIETDRKTLRGRAFPLVNSGKVVALTEVGYRTRHLDAPITVRGACGPQAAFALQQPSARGALVPSWVVAGFRVFPFAERTRGTFVDERQQLTVTTDEDDSTVISAATFDTPRVLFTGKLPHPGARPIVQLAEHERHWLVLFEAPGRRDCCAGDVVMWLMRFTLSDDEQVTVETGRGYHSGFAEGCAQETFTDLDGEPRCERLTEGCELADPKLP
jgi:hypothetical protein